MKICVFCHDAYMSGANMALRDYINCDNMNKYLLVIPHKNRKLKNEFINNNIEIIEGNYFNINKNINKLTLKNKCKKIIKIIYMIIFKKIIYVNLSKKISHYNPDVIISNTFSLYYGAEIANYLGYQHIWYVREFMDLDHNIKHYDEGKIKKLCENSNAIFISDVIKEYYLKKYKFSSYTTIYDQVEFRSNYKYNKTLKFNKLKVRIIMVGMLQEGKGQMEAIKAVEILHNKGYLIELDIYGVGQDYNKLQNYIKKKRIDYIFLKGFCKNVNENRHLYNIALICSKNEALGRVTVEAMYYGNVAIGSDSGCTKYIIKDKNTGLLYKNGNYYDLADKIESAILNVDMSNKLLKEARTYAINNFSKPITEKIVDYIKIIKSR